MYTVTRDSNAANVDAEVYRSSLGTEDNILYSPIVCSQL